jgi:D-amino-acid dehydrogenase
LARLLRSEANVDIVIIGGGVIGLSQALELAHRDLAVTVLDAGTTGTGASAVNAGWVVPAEAAPVPGPGMISKSVQWMLHSDSPLYIKPALSPGYLQFMLTMARRSNARDFRLGLAAQLSLAEDAMQILDGYVTEGIDFEMHERGLLMAFLSAENFRHHREMLDVATSFGLEPETLTGSEVRDREPALSPGVLGGIFFPHERHLDPVTLVDALRKRCIQMGVAVEEFSRVDQVERSGSRAIAVRSRERRFAADRFVLAAGAWSGPLSRMFGVPLPVHPGKGYSADLAPPPVSLRTMVKLSDAMVATTPLNSRLRLAGTMEFGSFNESVRRARVDAILAAGPRYFHTWVPPKQPPVIGVGIRPMTPDGLPVIGRLGNLENCYISSGHGMMGLTLAGATAQALTQQILGAGTIPVSLLPFAPGRFGRRHGI